MNILYEEQVAVTGIYWLKLFGIITVMTLILLAAIMLCALIISCIYVGDWAYWVITFIALIIYVFAIDKAISNECLYTKGYQTEYKILMDDSLDMTVKEFYETYDVKEVEGSIWTIRTKEITENEKERKE